MERLCALALALALSQESLRFIPAFEQTAEASCGLSAVASLLTIYCDRTVDELRLAFLLERRWEEEKGQPSAAPAAAAAISVGDVIALLGDCGVDARAFRMDQVGLRVALESGFAPAIVHYEKPDRHFALALGVAGNGAAGHGAAIWALGDPARGGEVLSAEQFEARWSGIAVLVDPKAVGVLGAAKAAEYSKYLFARYAMLSQLGASHNFPFDRVGP